MCQSCGKRREWSGQIQNELQIQGGRTTRGVVSYMLWDTCSTVFVTVRGTFGPETQICTTGKIWWMIVFQLLETYKQHRRSDVLNLLLYSHVVWNWWTFWFEKRPKNLKQDEMWQLILNLPYVYVFPHFPRSIYEPNSLVAMETKFGERPDADAFSPQSEAVTNELQELSLHPAPNLLPIKERKNGKCQEQNQKQHVW